MSDAQLTRWKNRAHKAEARLKQLEAIDETARQMITGLKVAEGALQGILDVMPSSPAARRALVAVQKAILAYKEACDG